LKQNKIEICCIHFSSIEFLFTSSISIDVRMTKQMVSKTIYQKSFIPSGSYEHDSYFHICMRSPEFGSIVRTRNRETEMNNRIVQQLGILKQNYFSIMQLFEYVNHYPYFPLKQIEL